MPRLRLAARFLLVRSSLPCEAGTSFAPLNSSPQSSWGPISSVARLPVEVSAEEERSPRLLRIFSHYQTATGTEVKDRSPSHPHVGRPPVVCRHLSGDLHRHDLNFGVNQRLQAPPLGRCRGLHSGSAVFSRETTYSENDLIDGLRWRATPVSSGSENSGASRGLHTSDGEDSEVDDGEEFFSSHHETSAPGDKGRSTTLSYDEEGTGELDPRLLRSSDDESDLSELKFVGRDDNLSDEPGNGDFEGAESRPEEEENTQWTGSRLDRLPFGASPEMGQGMSELFSDFSDMVSGRGEDSGDGVVTESEPRGDDPEDGLPYLHALSVEEVREILEKARAKDVRILQVRNCCEWVDHMVFASGRSSRHLRGMADAIVYKVKQLSENVGPNSFPPVEGRDGEQWMAIDCTNIVIHLFLEEARSYYNLEEFWANKSNPRLVETY